jgi:hypothetical protein
MQAIYRGTSAPVLKNTYDTDGNIESQSLSSGEKFEYHFSKRPQNSAGAQGYIVAPNGLLTFFRYGGDSYTQSLPTHAPNEKH